MKSLREKLKALRIKIYWWNVKRTCKHQLTTEMFRSYPDGYVKEQCNTCNKEFYFDL
jgi:tRNA U34 2-thiouridine synthase MnmA/TrmU